VFWHPKGWTLFQTLENYIRRRQADAGYAEVNAPQLIDSSLWVASGHMATFRDAMFFGGTPQGRRAHLRGQPMNCPGHIQIFKNGLNPIATCRSRSPSSARCTVSSRPARCMD